MLQLNSYRALEIKYMHISCVICMRMTNDVTFVQVEDFYSQTNNKCRMNLITQQKLKLHHIILEIVHNTTQIVFASTFSFLVM